jgi:hypothetical protein
MLHVVGAILRLRSGQALRLRRPARQKTARKKKPSRFAQDDKRRKEGGVKPATTKAIR